MNVAFPLCILTELILFTALIECNPRRSWDSGPKYNFDADNEGCADNLQCVQVWKCPQDSHYAKPSGSCANKKNGPWVCCCTADGAAGDHSHNDFSQIKPGIVHKLNIKPRKRTHQWVDAGENSGDPKIGSWARNARPGSVGELPINSWERPNVADSWNPEAWSDDRSKSTPGSRHSGSTRHRSTTDHRIVFPTESWTRKTTRATAKPSARKTTSSQAWKTSEESFTRSSHRPWTPSTSKSWLHSTEKPRSHSSAKPWSYSTTKSSAYSTPKPWSQSSTKSWTHSTAKPWSPSSTKSWTHSTAKPWSPSSTKSWTHSTTKSWSHSSEKPKQPSATKSTEKHWSQSTKRLWTHSSEKTWSHSTTESWIPSTKKPSPRSTARPRTQSSTKSTAHLTSKSWSSTSAPPARTTKYLGGPTPRTPKPTKRTASPTKAVNVGPGNDERRNPDRDYPRSRAPTRRSSVSSTTPYSRTSAATSSRTTSTPLPNVNDHLCGFRDETLFPSIGDIDIDDVNIPYPSEHQTFIASFTFRAYSMFQNVTTVTASPRLDSRNGRKRRTFQRIVGGKEADPFSWPWVAALYKVTTSGGKRFSCAGSLINENLVLTAAHPFTPEDIRSSSYVVMLGTHNAQDAIAEYRVSTVVQHPQYEQRFYYHDIALLRLDRPVAFNGFVMPLCLPSPNAPLFRDRDLEGKNVTVAGWGDDSFGGKSSRVLKEATFPIASRRSCNASYIRVASNRFPRGITENMLCAGSPRGGKDACQGDSGGPLMSYEGGRYTQVGIVSFGYKCGDKDFPGVYTKVAPYLSWIAEHTESAPERAPDYDYDYEYGR